VNSRPIQTIRTAPQRSPERPVTILVVDDSRLQRRLLSCNLERWGYEVFEAESGVDALTICDAAQVDMIISDWMMPGMDGLTFCRRFRDRKRSSYSYFILLTSKDGKDEIAEGLDVGADDFLTKPVNSGELRARINAGERVLGMQNELVEKNRSITLALTELQGLYAAIDRDLLEAKKLQQSLIPETHLKFPNVQISMILQSSGHIGGDMIGVYHTGPDRIGLYGFDVSGHGISSALMTARLAGCLGSGNPAYSIAMSRQEDGSYAPKPVDEIAVALNTRMVEEMDTDLYMTILLADADLTTGKVQMVQAGHPPPLVLRAGDAPEYIGTGGLPIGLIPGAQFQAVETTLGPGDRLLIHSDGFIEAEGKDGQFLGEDRFSQTLAFHADTTGPELLSNLVLEAHNFTGRSETSDDLSAILLDFTPTDPSPETA